LFGDEDEKKVEEYSSDRINLPSFHNPIIPMNLTESTKRKI